MSTTHIYKDTKSPDFVVTYLYQDPNLSKLPVFVLLLIESILIYLGTIGNESDVLTVITVLVAAGSVIWYHTYFTKAIEMASGYLIMSLLRNAIVGIVYDNSYCLVFWLSFVIMYLDAFGQRSTMGYIQYVHEPIPVEVEAKTDGGQE